MPHGTVGEPIAGKKERFLAAPASIYRLTETIYKLREIERAEFERELIVERTRAGLAAARGRKRGAPFKMTPAKLRLPWPRWASGKPRSAPYARSWGSRGKRSTAMSARRGSYVRMATNCSAHAAWLTVEQVRGVWHRL